MTPPSAAATSRVADGCPQETTGVSPSSLRACPSLPDAPAAGEAKGRQPLTAVSLFAGIEGFGLALEQAGIQVTTAVEIDADCRGVIRRHFPSVTIRSDVTEVTADDLIADGFVPGRGILVAGWPCQGNSVAGRRGGMDDPRSGLWRHVVRLLAETRPAWFLGENVPGLLSVNGGADIAVVRGDLAQLGYWWAERILDAEYFGVPQRRNRVFFVGCAGDRAAPVEVLLEPESSPRHPPARGQARPRIAAASGGGARSPSTVGTLGGNGPGGGWRVGADEAAAGQLVAAPMTTRPYADNAAQEGSLIAATLQGGGRRGHRIDAEGAAGGHLIAAPFPSRAVSHALTAREGKGADSDAGSGFITVSHPITSREAKRSADSDATNGLIAVPVALRGRDAGNVPEADEPGDPAYAVRGPGGGSSYPMVAAPLTSGTATGAGVNRPRRRQEDDVNLVAHALTSEGAVLASRLLQYSRRDKPGNGPGRGPHRTADHDTPWRSPRGRRRGGPGGGRRPPPGARRTAGYPWPGFRKWLYAG